MTVAKAYKAGGACGPTADCEDDNAVCDAVLGLCMCNADNPMQVSDNTCGKLSLVSQSGHIIDIRKQEAFRERTHLHVFDLDFRLLPVSRSRDIKHKAYA